MTNVNAKAFRDQRTGKYFNMVKAYYELIFPFLVMLEHVIDPQKGIKYIYI